MILTKAVDYLKRIMFAFPLLSCQPAVEECYHYNQTSVPLTAQVNGGIENWEALTLESENPIINDALVHFINETHALASEGLPLNLKITRVPEHCNSGYTYIADSNAPEPFQGDRGIYVNQAITFSLIDTLNHEIGHFQQQGNTNEVISEINALEQQLMGYLLFLSQSSESDQLHWSQFNSGGKILRFLQNYLSTDSFDPNVPERYTEADFFIYLKLLEPGTSFASLRDESRRLSSKKQLEPTVQEAATPFRSQFMLSEYGTTTARQADLTVKVKRFFLEEISRKFGVGMAQQYVQLESLFPYTNQVWGIVQGLEGMCSQRGDTYLGPQQNYDSSGSNLPETTRYWQELRLPLCCVFMNKNGKHLSKRKIEAEGNRYLPESSGHLNGWDFIDIITNTRATDLEWNQPCLGD